MIVSGSPLLLSKPWVGFKGPVLNRPVSIGRETAKLRRELAAIFDEAGVQAISKLESTGALARLHEDATKRRAAQAKGPVGRGGRPLGPARTDELEDIFQYDAFQILTTLSADEEKAFRLAIEGTLEGAYTDLFTLGGNAARRALGVSGSFALESPAVAEALLARANLLSGNVADDVFERLKTVLADQFYLQGKSPLEAGKVLAQEFDWLSESRAELIARTESGAVVEEAQWLTYYVTGVPFKRWLTTLDGRERPDHFKAHGQIRAIDEPFILAEGTADEEELMHPLDPNGSAGQVCNCRCSEIPIVTEEQKLSDADVWDGRNNPDQFAKERREDPDLPPGLRPPPPSAVDDLDFAFPEDEKRFAADLAAIEQGRSFLQRARDWWQAGKAEREYERDDIGRFGRGSGPPKKPGEEEGGGGTATATPSPTMREHSPAVEQQLRDSEAAIQTQDFETAVVIDDEGNVALHKDGTANSVSLNEAESAGAYDRVMTHNHPNSTSFSGSDIDSAARSHVREIRAVGRDGTVYRMQSANESGLWPNPEGIAAARDAAIIPVQTEVSIAIQRGQLTPSEGEREHNHRIWERVAPQVGMIYQRDESRRVESAQIRGEREFFARLGGGSGGRRRR